MQQQWLAQDALRHSSTRPNHVYSCRDQLAKKSAHPSDEYNFPPNSLDLPIQDWYHSSHGE